MNTLATNEHDVPRKAWLGSVAVAVAYEGFLAQGVQTWVLGDAPRYPFVVIILSVLQSEVSTGRV